MVNILLVSHSYKLATERPNYAPDGDVRSLKVRVAAGIGDDHEEIGTNAVEIMEANRVDHGR